MRVFVAVNLPEKVRQGIWTATEGLRTTDFPVRWVDVTSLHLTLKFLGEVEDERRDEIVSAVEQGTNGARPFLLSMSGFGAFPSVERPRVIWVGCDAVPPLELLQHHLERELERCGFPVDGRPFRPHLTLGRVKKDVPAPSFQGLESALESLAFVGETLVQSVELMESRLGRDGSAYRPVHSVTFES